ncbi:uncharacterized protein LOC109613788 isoform X2 [Musca domestica]|uniref:Uncharacterized protein LOC109613788 isoform X2 n=1 Tax=Musca domestica TaxID=7370 RepID=A0ABM3ULE8_MUSDO|nr:uncharacterized protein LOC109613788 isoform X2 [Musca domestica]
MLIPTVLGEDKLFVEAPEPLNLQSFIKAAKLELKIDASRKITALVFGATIKEDQFEKVIHQYMSTPTFHIELQFGDSVRSVASASTVSGTLSECESVGGFGDLTPKTNVISTLKTDIESIKSIPAVNKIWRIFIAEKRLQNKDRVNISKALIDECLKEDPNRLLKREDFEVLAESIVHIFYTELASAYFLPSEKGCIARGKLWSAYNNKRTSLRSDGIISRRPRKDLKRKANVSLPSEAESIEYLTENTSDLSTIILKWQETHAYRRNELKGNISTFEYISKYPVLQGNNGIKLTTLDVKLLYSATEPVENWLMIYSNVLNHARTLRDKAVCNLLTKIDTSTEERLRAQLTLLLIPYILPHSGKRHETHEKKGRATKFEIQERFIKEYESIVQLKEDSITDLQIRFVKFGHDITYAQFNIAGFIYKCTDLLEALNIGFMYIMALDVAYPPLCKHVWEFIQLSIFNIKLPNEKVAIIETIIKDLF